MTLPNVGEQRHYSETIMSAAMNELNQQICLRAYYRTAFYGKAMGLEEKNTGV